MRRSWGGGWGWVGDGVRAVQWCWCHLLMLHRELDCFGLLAQVEWRVAVTPTSFLPPMCPLSSDPCPLHTSYTPCPLHTHTPQYHPCTRLQHLPGIASRPPWCGRGCRGPGLNNHHHHQSHHPTTTTKATTTIITATNTHTRTHTCTQYQGGSVLPRSSCG